LWLLRLSLGQPSTSRLNVGEEPEDDPACFALEVLAAAVAAIHQASVPLKARPVRAAGRCLLELVNARVGSADELAGSLLPEGFDLVSG
jgi:hypothetical protein